MTTMALNLQFEKGHSELDPRALMDPQTSTGMPPVSGGDQRRIRPSTGVESDDQARTRGMDSDGTSQPEISIPAEYRTIIRSYTFYAGSYHNGIQTTTSNFFNASFYKYIHVTQN